MTLVEMVDRIKAHPEYSKAGMILCHNGVVRETTRDGRAVTGLEVTVDHEKLQEIITAARQLPGIVDILIHIEENKRLRVGDDVMFIVVAGDIREHVIDALSQTLNRVKAEATDKTQFMKD